jgi:hypothetical protein
VFKFNARPWIKISDRRGGGDVSRDIHGVSNNPKISQ